MVKTNLSGMWSLKAFVPMLTCKMKVEMFPHYRLTSHSEAYEEKR